MIKFKIKKIQPHQFSKLAKILVKIYFKTFTKQELYYPYTLRNKNIFTLRNLKKIKCEIYVVIYKNKIIGGVFYYSNLDNYKLYIRSKPYKTSAIRYLAVDNQYSGNAIGIELLNMCINKTKKDKNKRLILHTLDTMIEAISIYEKLGFKRDKKIDFYVGNIHIKGYNKTII